MAGVAATLKEDGSPNIHELVCDTGYFESVRACAATVLALPEITSIDVLLLNAGAGPGAKDLMTVNHLGHFLFTGLIFSRLSSDCRIITVSSHAHKIGEDIPWDRVGAKQKLKDAYGYSKAANLLFVEELNRLLLLKGSSIVAVGAHPGVSSTNIMRKIDPSITQRLFSFFMRNVGQPVAHGAWPLLMAATDPEITRDCYYATSNSFLVIKECNGPRKGHKAKSINEVSAKKCWEESEKITKFDFKI